MAEEKVENTEAPPAKKGLVRMLLIPLVVGVVCTGLGFSIPVVFPSLLGVEHEAEAPPPPPEPSFVPFGEVVVNLNEGRMNRYLRVKITLQTLVEHAHHEGEHGELEAMIEGKKAILTSWLLAYLADLQMEDIRGAAGQARLRREINDHFNRVLYPEGEGQIDDVLFEEFNVQ